MILERHRTVEDIHRTCMFKLNDVLHLERPGITLQLFRVSRNNLSLQRMATNVFADWIRLISFVFLISSLSFCFTKHTQMRSPLHKYFSFLHDNKSQNQEIACKWELAWIYSSYVLTHSLPRWMTLEYDYRKSWQQIKPAGRTPDPVKLHEMRSVSQVIAKMLSNITQLVVLNDG